MADLGLSLCGLLCRTEVFMCTLVTYQGGPYKTLIKKNLINKGLIGKGKLCGNMRKMCWQDSFI